VEYPTYVFLAPALAWAFLDRSWPGGAWLSAPALVLVVLLGWNGVTLPLAGALPLALTALPAGTTLFTVWLVAYARLRGRGRPAAAEVVAEAA
jgi:hypothetical protein